MFTGLVQCVGEVVSVDAQAQGRTLTIRSELSLADRALGASIAVKGVCLTVTAAQGQTFRAFAGFETLAASTLDRLQVGDQVNLEPALRVGDPLGGHLVGGHVDGVGTLRRVQPRGPTHELTFEAPQDLMHMVAVKGSIAIDGVSLTVNAVQAASFCVGVIPHTLGATTLAAIRPGARVNLEVDLIARYVARLHTSAGRSSPGAPGLALSTLHRAGF